MGPDGETEATANACGAYTSGSGTAGGVAPACVRPPLPVDEPVLVSFAPSGDEHGWAVTNSEIEIRRFRDEDLDAVVAFSLRAWAPVFASVRDVLGDEIFLRLHPDWTVSQTEAVRASCANDDTDVFVAVADGRPIGFVTVALNAFHERMGVIEIIGVDPDHQRRGIATRLTEHAVAHMKDSGMDIAVVETGGDPGHAPARATYDAAGFTVLPIARYFQLLD
jgi:ribosomal protein S18 acetylase RimI-like enzyme